MVDGPVRPGDQQRRTGEPTPRHPGLLTAEQLIRIDRFDRAAVQRRTLITLCVSAIFGRAGMTAAFAVAALLVKEIFDAETWAGVASAAFTVGTAVSSAALSGYMARRGRRPGLSIGFVAAVAGGGLAVLGGQLALDGTRLLIALYLAGLVGIGVGQGANNLARYAATDLADEDKRGRSISLVVFASSIGAIGGPLLIGPAGRLGESVGLQELVGPYLLSIAFFAFGSLVLWLGLRPDPLVVAGGLDADATVDQRSSFADGWAALAASPLSRLAVVGLVVSQAVMVMVMAMTPLHMDAHGHGLDAVGWVISVHTAGMFAFAPLAGWSADRFGRIPTLATGAVLLIVSTIMTALAGEAPAILMFPGLFLLGLGWAFGMVAASALVAESVEPSSSVAAQGAADLITAFVSGAGALASGFVFSMAGFHILSMLGILAAGVLLVLVFYRHQVDTRLAAAR
ncbi:MAG: MFS transporter [Actinomycetota bacterium]